MLCSAKDQDAIYLLWIERLRDPAFLSGDWYLSTPMMHPNIVHPLRHVCDWLGDANGFLAALALSRLLLVAGVWRLTRVLGGSRIAAGMGALLTIFSPRVSLGGHFPSGSFFDPSQLGMALATLALVALLERRHLLCGIWLGITIHVHLFLGAHVAAVITLAVFFTQRPWRARASDLARIALPAFALAAWTLFDAGRGWLAARAGAGLTGAQIVEVLAFRHPHHHSPLSWSALPSILYIIYVALGLTIARRRGWLSQPVIRALYLYAALAMIIGTVFVEWIPVSLVALFQFFRISGLLMIWTAAAVALWLAPCIEAALRQRRLRPDAVLALLAAIAFRMPYVFLPLAALCWFLARASAWKTSEECESKALPAEAGTTNSCALPAFALAIGLLVFFGGATGHLNPLFAQLGRREHFRLHVDSPDPVVNTLAAYLRTHTPPSATILFPPGIEGLPLYARRASVVTFKQMTFTPPDLREWVGRIIEVSLLGRFVPGQPRAQWGDPYAVLPHLHAIRGQRINPQTAIDEGYRLLTADEARGLGQRYGASIFITDSPAPYPFALLTRVGEYAVYRMAKEKE